MTEILVMSQFNAERYAENKNDINSAVISIVSHGSDEAHLFESKTNGIKSILRLEFNDTDGEDGITEEDAIAIVDFSKSAILMDRIIVHCGAGRSRSAGVAAAIMKFYFNDDTPIFNSPRYTPNMRCYRKVLERLNESYEDAKDKLNDNFKASLENMPGGIKNSIKLYTCCFMQLLTTKMSEKDTDEVIRILDDNLSILMSARNELYKTIKPNEEIPELSGKI